MFDPKSLLNALSILDPKGLTELFEQLTGHTRHINTTIIGEDTAIEGNGYVLTFCPQSLSLHHRGHWRLNVTEEDVTVISDVIEEDATVKVPTHCIEVLRGRLPHQSFVDINAPDDEDIFGVVAILAHDVIAYRADTFYVFDKQAFMQSTRYVDRPAPPQPKLSIERVWGSMSYAKGCLHGQVIQCIISQQNGRWSVDWFGAKTYLEPITEHDDKQHRANLAQRSTPCMKNI